MANNNIQTNSFAKELLSWVILFAAAIVVAILINRFVLANTVVPTGSMISTINEKDRLFGNRLAYLFKDPQRGDIIIFKNPDDESENYIKRCIGLPGETVEIKDGVTYINGEKLDEPYLYETPYKLNFGPYEVPEDCYFMMGDNRNHSLDARYWENTYVSRDKIIAKAFLRYYPSIDFIE